MIHTPKYLFQNKDNHGDAPAISIKDSNGNWQTESWKDYLDSVTSVAKSLLAAGIQKNDKVSLYSYNRKEWSYCYSAIQLINGVAVGVYHTSSSDEVEWVVDNSDSKIVFVGNNPNDNDENNKKPNYRLFDIIDKLKKLEMIVVMNGGKLLDHPKIISWEKFIEQGKNISDDKIQKRYEQISIDDVSSLIYTSGTTGKPKGVELTFRNWTFTMNSLMKFLKFKPKDSIVSWLPGAHVFGQALDCHYWAMNSMHMHIVDDPLNTVDYAKEVQPNLFCSVPRIYEKIFSNLTAAINQKAILKYGLKLPGISYLLKKKLKTAVGFGNLTFAISGAAPINPEILDLFQKLDIPLFEGYGMTENTAAATLNYTNHNKIGSVGPPIDETEVKISENGEVLIKGNHVMRGYYKNDEATKETIIDNWLHTGDVGKIDSDGYLYITGRIKEIYVSSGGKNIAPLVIEETMKSIPLVSQCFLIGDKRKYCSALLTLDVGAILRDKLMVETLKIPKNPLEQIKMLEAMGKELADYTNNESVRKEIEERVEELNQKFSNPEQIKKFFILPRDFSIDFGELTPTLKIRRKQITENWSKEIESMY